MSIKRTIDMPSAYDKYEQSCNRFPPDTEIPFSSMDFVHRDFFLVKLQIQIRLHFIKGPFSRSLF